MGAGDGVEDALPGDDGGRAAAGDDEKRFRRRVEHWKESALGFLPEIYTLRKAINSISQRYFDGQEALFPEVAGGFGQLLASAEKLFDIYNEALAGAIERL